jgi:hypothetical protein
LEQKSIIDRERREDDHGSICCVGSWEGCVAWYEEDQGGFPNFEQNGWFDQCGTRVDDGYFAVDEVIEVD